MCSSVFGPAMPPPLVTWPTTNTVGAQLHLERGFLTGGVERGMTAALELRGDLQQQRRLADARLAADQNHRARHDAAAEHEVEFVDARLPALGFGAVDFAQPRREG